ncbi:hypothetical protein DFR69_102741 [Nocardia neocaledoniensis]|uniref:Uncharacterized protein n=2 Tax=Nocardia neocaledoniensis TaxID=236511 RepID=A0A317NXG2_9NOCA|nr:hypothetical protein DFR69_102741 [Nocardia neocaledoniensis]
MIVRTWKKVAPATQFIRNTVQIVAGCLVVRDEAASMIEIIADGIAAMLLLP